MSAPPYGLISEQALVLRLVYNCNKTRDVKLATQRAGQLSINSTESETTAIDRLFAAIVSVLLKRVLYNKGTVE